MRSVVIRGSVSFDKRPGVYIQQVIDSIRSWHTGELILSTWNNQQHAAQGLIGVDKVVCSDDPGEGPVQQFLRQAQSYYVGVSVSTGSEVMVTRTDILHFKDLFELRNTYPKKTKANISAFDEKLLIGNMMTIRPGSDIDISTYRANDWFQVGTREDILKWGRVFEDIPKLDINRITELRNNGSICTENLWFKMLLKRYVNPELDITEWPDDLAMHALLDNFEVMNTITTARAINLNWAFQPQRLGCYLTEEQYLHEYNALCE